MPRDLRAAAAATLAFATVLTIACGGESTAPPPPAAKLEVAVVNVRGPSVLESGPSQAVVRCDVKFRASVTGSGSVTFRDARFMFFAGEDHSAPVDVIDISDEDVQAGWDGGVLEAGRTRESVWYFQLGAPFVLTGEFRYSSPGARGSAPVRVVCGPEAPLTSAPPTITNVTLSPPTDGLEPGYTLVVSYTASAAAGIWHTAVEVAGPCELTAEFPENLQPTLTRNVSLRMPAGCALGVPLRVTVYAVDAALREISRESTGPALVDHTAPIIAAFVQPVAGAVSSTIQFAADSINVRIDAYDNAGIRTIVSELLPMGHRDSVVISSPFTGFLRVPVPSDVMGFVQLRLYARDGAGLMSNEVVTAPGTIKVYPTVERTTLRSPLRAWVRDVAIDPARGSIYVLAFNERRIYVLSSETLAIARTIDLPIDPTSIDFTPSGDSLLLTGGATGLTVVDLRQPTPVVSSLPLTLDESTVQRATRVRVLANGKAFVALQGTTSQAFQLVEVDLTTGAQRTRTDAANASGFAQASTIQRSPDRVAFVFNGGFGHLRRYDATTDQFTVGGDVISPGRDFSLDRGGQHNAVSLDIHDASLTLIRRVESIVTSGALVQSAISADGASLYHLTPSGVLRSRVSDGLLIDRTRKPADADLIRIASDDSFLVTWPEWQVGGLSLIRLHP